MQDSKLQSNAKGTTAYRNLCLKPTESLDDQQTNEVSR
jgi:hypothetical protein